MGEDGFAGRDRSTWNTRRHRVSLPGRQHRSTWNIGKTESFLRDGVDLKKVALVRRVNSELAFARSVGGPEPAHQARCAKGPEPRGRLARADGTAHRRRGVEARTRPCAARTRLGHSSWRPIPSHHRLPNLVV